MAAKAKAMTTGKLTVMALMGGVVLGAAATGGFDAYRQSRDSRVFEERAHCKALADAYVKAHSTAAEANPDSSGFVSVELDNVAYSPARNSCVAALETTIAIPHVAIVSESVEDLLSGRPCSPPAVRRNVRQRPCCSPRPATHSIMC